MTNEEKPQKNRAGDTVTTSASVSGKFRELFNEFNLSATECMRRGIAVTLHDLGVDQYQTELNKARSDYVKRFMENIKKDEEMRKAEDLLEELNKVEKIIKDIKKENASSTN